MSGAAEVTRATQVAKAALTIPAAVRRAWQQWPDDDAVVDGDTRLSWTGLADRMADVARALAGSGIRSGDRVALWAPNSAEWIVAALGVYAAGAVLVPVNTRFKLGEGAQVLRIARVKMLFTVTDFLGTNYAEQLADDRELSRTMETVVLSGPPGHSTPWEQFLARGEDEPSREADIQADDVSDIVFTSGTTGLPKGAMLTHGASTRTYASWSETVGLRHGDRYLVVYPFFHCAGLKSGILACILTGATVVPCPVFDVATVMKLVERERISMLPGPPTLFQSLLNADLGDTDRSSLRLSVTGAAVVPVELVREMRDRLGFSSVVTGYGLTETTGTVSMCRHDDPIEIVATTSGRPIPGMAVRVVGADHVDAPAGTPGEVLVKGFAVMRGYFDDPAATAAVISGDGWLRTGDVGVLDEAGNIRITDRIKDMFIVGGFNAYPAEIENRILDHPDVAQVAVVGVPDDRLGEVGCAFVIPRRGSTTTAEELIGWCRAVMANFKAPRYVQLVEDLPLNASGKVVKFELRTRAQRMVRGAVGG